MTDISIRNQRRYYTGAALFALWFALNITMLMVHSQWRDEAQVWLLDRDMGPVQLFRQMGIEGHSCLWHYIVFPVVRLGLPYIVPNIIAFVLCIPAAWLLAFKSPFGFITKLVIILGPLMSFHFPVFARPYAIIPATLLGLAFFHGKRLEKPWLYCALISLLIHTHVIMAFTSFLLSACFFFSCIFTYFRENKAGTNAASVAKDSPKAVTPLRKLLGRLSALSLPLVSILLLAAMLMNVGESSLLKVKSVGIDETLKRMLLKTLQGMNETMGTGDEFNICLLFLGLITFVIYAVINWKRVKDKMDIVTVGIVIVGSWAGQFWMYAMAYGYATQRLMAFMLLIVWGCWVTGNTEKLPRESCAAASSKPLALLYSVKPCEVLLAVFCAIVLCGQFTDMTREFNPETPFSGARHAADWIKENIPYDEALMLADDQAYSTAIMAFLPSKKPWVYVGNGNLFTYVDWREGWHDEITYEDFSAWLDGNVKNQPGEAYLVITMVACNLENKHLLQNEYELLYQSPYGSKKNETYEIYRIK